MTAPAQSWEDDDALSERAAEIFERRRFGDWSGADQAALDAWLVESTANRVAWLRVTAIAARADQLAAFRPFERRQAAQDVRRKASIWWFVSPVLAAATVALFAVFGWPVLTAWMQPTDRTDSTDIGGRTLLSFSDHTQIELNTDSAMRFRMTNEERTVWLEKGEAWFHVTHDATHPFTVVVGRHRITDLGTEFLVRRSGDDVEVALLNGRAALSAGGVQTATLNPGDEAMVTPVALSVTRKTPQEMADELAWRRGMLVFRNAPLSDVVREFNRYNKIKLVIADPSIAEAPFSAELKTDDYVAFLNLAQALMNLHADREGNEILISRGPREKTKKTVHARHD